MIIYKRLRKISAISFDLDDTLYDNKPVMQRAEQAMVDFLASHYPATHNMGLTGWLSVKIRVGQQQPSLKHDVTRWRQATITAGLLELGYSSAQATIGSAKAFKHFLSIRSQVSIPAFSYHLLKKLKKKYPLIAITNGNVPLDAIGLGAYFDLLFAAGNDMKMKPESDLFDAAIDALQLPAHEILHIGDHLITDVSGAMQNGLQSVWLNLNPTKNAHYQLLPNVEIHALEELNVLL